MIFCSKPECQSTAGCRCRELSQFVWTPPARRAPDAEVVAPATWTYDVVVDIAPAKPSPELQAKIAELIQKAMTAWLWNVATGGYPVGYDRRTGTPSVMRYSDLERKSEAPRCGYFLNPDAIT